MRSKYGFKKLVQITTIFNYFSIKLFGMNKKASSTDAGDFSNKLK